MKLISLSFKLWERSGCLMDIAGSASYYQLDESRAIVLHFPISIFFALNTRSVHAGAMYFKCYRQLTAVLMFVSTAATFVDFFSVELGGHLERECIVPLLTLACCKSVQPTNRKNGYERVNEILFIGYCHNWHFTRWSGLGRALRYLKDFSVWHSHPSEPGYPNFCVNNFRDVICNNLSAVAIYSLKIVQCGSWYNDAMKLSEYWNRFWYTGQSYQS